MTTATAMIDPAELATLRAELAAARARADDAVKEVHHILNSNRLARGYDQVASFMRIDGAENYFKKGTLLDGVMELMSRVDKAELDLEDMTRRALRAEDALAAARADAALWRQRVQDTRPILELVEEVSANPSPATVKALTDAFEAWRMLVEGGAPATWCVAEPGAAVAGDDCRF